MTPQLREALQAMNKLTPAEKQEFLRIVIDTPEEATIPTSLPLQRVLATQNPPVIYDISSLKAEFWPEDESIEDFLQWREEQKQKDLVDSQKHLEEMLQDDE